MFTLNPENVQQVKCICPYFGIIFMIIIAAILREAITSKKVWFRESVAATFSTRGSLGVCDYFVFVIRFVIVITIFEEAHEVMKIQI